MAKLTHDQDDSYVPASVREYVIKETAKATAEILAIVSELRAPLEARVETLMLERARRDGMEEQKTKSDAKLRNALIVSQIAIGAIVTIAIKFFK